MAVGEAEARKLLASAGRVEILSHVDLDGLASSAVVARWASSRGIEHQQHVAGARGLYAMARKLLQQLAGSSRGVLVIADLGPKDLATAEALVSYAERVGGIVWVDHHEWPSEALEALSRHSSVAVVHDRSRCSAEIMCSVVGCWDDSHSKVLVELARADDSCSSDPYGLAEKWRLVLRYLDWEGLRRAARDLAEGNLWPDWADNLYKQRSAEYYEQLRSTLTTIHEANGVRVAAVVPPPSASACDLQRFGLVPGPSEADVVVIVYPKGLSIKTWGKLRANCIAEKLGGGGHANVAGAPRPSQTMGPAQIARMVAKLAAACKGEVAGSHTREH
ncbi:MAG: hypothetical protein ABWW70_02870 [Thermoproteota archaeon]